MIIMCYQCANDDCVDECTEALVVQKVRIIVGASLSEINTSVTSLHTCMCMLIKEWVDYVGMAPTRAIYAKSHAEDS